MTVVAQILLTLRDDNSALDSDHTMELVERSLGARIDIVTLNGIVSEQEFVPTEEKRAIARRVADQFSGDMDRFLVGVNGGIDELKTQIAFHSDLGFDHFMIHPFASPFIASEGWREFTTEVARAFPSARFTPYVKHPHITGQEINRLFDSCANVELVKFSQQADIGYTTLSQVAEEHLSRLLDGLAEGSFVSRRWSGLNGFTSGLANVFPRTVRHFADNRECSADIVECIQEIEHLRVSDHGAFSIALLKRLAKIQFGVSEQMMPPGMSMRLAQLAERMSVFEGSLVEQVSA
jgi:4-hydroxy-tetrahydrodipicolinate synthase